MAHMGDFYGPDMHLWARYHIMSTRPKHIVIANDMKAGKYILTVCPGIKGHVFLSTDSECN